MLFLNNNFNIKSIVFLLILIYYIVKIDCKIGRGGGGGFRSSSGSRFRSSVGGAKPGVPLKPNGPNYNRYNSYSNYRGGVRWSSFGAGMVAYGVMSSLMSRGHYHHSYYHGSPGYSNSRIRGSVCVNNEDFNGTKFGSFMCPLPGFTESASYCCGSLENQTQYCCEFFDDETRKYAVIIAIFSIIGILVCILGFSIRIYGMIQKRRRQQKLTNNGSFAQMPINLRNINRNFTQPGPRPAQPIYNNQNKNFSNRPEDVPFLPNNNTIYSNNNPNFNPNNSNAPYPTHSNMPQPMIIPNITLTAPTESSPPCYSEAVKQ